MILYPELPLRPPLRVELARQLEFLVRRLHVEYAERGREYCILFIVSLFCDYSHLEYVRIHVIYRVNQAEYVITILVVAPQEYVNIYSTCRVRSPCMCMHILLIYTYIHI